RPGCRRSPAPCETGWSCAAGRSRWRRPIPSAPGCWPGIPPPAPSAGPTCAKRSCGGRPCRRLPGPRCPGTDWLDDAEFHAHGIDPPTAAAIRRWAQEWADDIAERLLEGEDPPE